MRESSSHPYGGRPYQLITPEQLEEANLAGIFLTLSGWEEGGATSQTFVTVGKFHSLKKASDDLTHVFMCETEDGTAFHGMIHLQGFTTFSQQVVD